MTRSFGNVVTISGLVEVDAGFEEVDSGLVDVTSGLAGVISGFTVSGIFWSGGDWRSIDGKMSLAMLSVDQMLSYKRIF